MIGDPVRADVTEAQPVRPDSGNGQSTFFLAFLVNLSGLIGGAVIFFLAGAAAERMEGLGLRTSRTGLWTVRLLLGLVFGLLIAGSELLVAFGLLGVEHGAGIPVPHARHDGCRVRDHALRSGVRACRHSHQRGFERDPWPRLLWRPRAP